MSKKLTPKQAAFIDEYLIDLNATAAAKRAGYSAKSAEIIGHENLRKPKIAQAVEAALHERAEQAHVTAQQVVEGLLAEATYQGEGASHSARVAAWGHLGKHLGMFSEKHEHTGGVEVRVVRE